MRANRSIGALTIALALASPAAASGGIFCENANASVDIAMGHLPVVQVLGAFIEADGKAFSTGPERGPGEPIVIGQAFGDDDVMMFDFVDPNFEAILVRIRLRFVAGNEDVPLAGVVTIGDGAPIAIECSAG